MCGRYVIFDVSDMAQGIAALNRESDFARMKWGEIRPTDMAPVIARDGPFPMAWGFPGPGGGMVINARCETAGEKPMFKQAMRDGRAVIPTTGFLEWSKGAGGAPKVKYLFNLSGQRTLYMAGLWRLYDGPGGPERRFVVLTTEANASMRPIHDRMPVIVLESEMGAWLSDARAADAILRREPPDLSWQAQGAQQLSFF